MNEGNQGRIDAGLRQIAKAGGITFLGTTVEIGISFFAKILVGRYLTVADFGSISLALKILAFMSIFGALGIGPGLSRFVPRHSNSADRRGYFVSGYQIVVVASFAIGASVFLSADHLAHSVFQEPGLAPVLRIIAFAIPANVLIRSADGAIGALEFSGPEVVTKSIVWPVSRIVLVVGVVLMGGTVLHIAGAYFASYWIAALVAVAVIVYYTPVLDRSTDWNSKHLELLRFSVPLSAAGTMGFLLASVDTFMIGFFLPIAAVGVYSVAFTLGSTMTIPLSALNTLFVPTFSRVEVEGSIDEMQRIYVMMTKWATFMALPMFLTMTLFSSTIIFYSFGEKYIDGAILLPIIALGFFVRAVLGPNRNSLEAIGRTRVIMWSNVIVAALNIVLNFVLIQRIGLLGAAIASFASFALLNLIYSLALYSDTGIHPISRRIYVPAAIYSIFLVVLASIFRRLLPQSLYALALFVAFGGIAYPFVIALAGGISHEDMMIVRSIEERSGVQLGPLKRYIRRLM